MNKTFNMAEAVEWMRLKGMELRYQDNACTSHPLFAVMELRRMYGFDDAYTETFEWIQSGEPLPDEDADACEAKYIDNGYYNDNEDVERVGNTKDSIHGGIRHRWASGPHNALIHRARKERFTMSKDANEGFDASHCSTARKPLGRKSYGSIGHLPNSRLGPSDSCVTEGQAKICTSKARDKHDTIIVQEKLDGSNVGVALLNGEIIPLSRAGYHARTSPFEQHHIFADWVAKHEKRFRRVLREGERICGEWLAQAHGTIYACGLQLDPFAAFDIMVGPDRKTFQEFTEQLDTVFQTPTLLHCGSPLSVEDAMKIHEEYHYPCDEIEGVVYRVERHGKVDFLAKYVRPDKVDGKYLESVTGQPNVWNWRP